METVLDQVVDHDAPGGVVDPAVMSDEALASELVAHAGWEHAGLVRVLDVVVEFDRRECWRVWGCAGTVQWLSWKCGVGSVAAHERLRVARALEGLPCLRAAWRSGEVSWSKVRAITRVASVVDEQDWVAWATVATAQMIERAAAAARRLTAADAVAQELERGLRWEQHPDGSVSLHCRLTGEEAAAVRAVIDEATVPARGVPIAVSRADALVTRVVEGPVRAEVVVHRMPSGVVHTDDGSPLAGEVAEMLACDGVVTTVVDGPEAAVVARDPAPSTAQRRWLARRHPTCQFPGCAHTGAFHAHHVVERGQGGATRLSNLVRLCPYHHRRVHVEGWRVSLHLPDRRVEVHDRDGRAVARMPEPSSFHVETAPVHGRVAGAWHGERMSMAECLTVLDMRHRAATGRSIVPPRRPVRAAWRGGAPPPTAA